MEKLLEKWIKKHNELLEELIELDDKYNNDIKKMPEKVYRKHRILSSEMLTYYEVINDVKKELQNNLDYIDKKLEV